MNGWVEGCAEGRRILNLARLGLSSRRSESLEAVIGGGGIGVFCFWVWSSLVPDPGGNLE